MIGSSRGIILLDSGSAHSFLHLPIAKEVGLPIETSKRLTVVVANGQRIISPGVCKNVKWTMHGREFRFNLRLIELGCYDVILGVDWMRHYNPMEFDFVNSRVNFMMNGSAVQLQGMRDAKHRSHSEMQALIKDMSAREDQKIEAIFCMLEDDSGLSRGTAEGKADDDSAEILRLLTEYTEIFDEPVELPPERSFDHQIILKTGSESVNLRLYRYPHAQKTKIEDQIRKMLDNSLIRTSHSPFASPIPLVKKKDGSYRPGDFVWIIES